MARKKISEFRAKSILATSLEQPYGGVSFDTQLDDFSKLYELDASKTYVVKVDEGVKKRMKQGLLALNKKPQELEQEIKRLQEEGYTHFIIEPFVTHESSSEKYLSLEQLRDGVQVLFSHQGGIEIEDNQDKIKRVVVNSQQDAEEFAKSVDLESNLLNKLRDVFGKYYFSFLEINPLVLENGKYTFLDVAAEVDSTGEFFVKQAWSENDFRTGIVKVRSQEEQAVQSLAAKSQAAFSLEVLNSNGSIFMMLSGGGASIVLADEVYNKGFGKELTNYGEYSGNPNAEETYIYAKAVLSLLLRSTAKKKVLVIAGGVANFTDVRITFKGLVKALNEVKDQLKDNGVKVFVRRGGPYQEEGLNMMKKFLEEVGLLGLVEGPEMVLTDIVVKAIDEIK